MKRNKLISDFGRKNLEKGIAKARMLCYNACMAPKRGLHRGIAQLVEYRSPKPWVAGSNPPAPVKKH